jgi:isopentenyldiphosphate isomerase
LRQGCSESGEFTEPALTTEDTKNGLLHASSHVWLWRCSAKGVEILLQKRAPTKLTWPNLYDISAAGHVDFGELPIEAAQRETKEELGLDLVQKDLHLLYVYRQHLVDPNSGFIENEFQWVFGQELKTDIDIVFEDGEVSAIKWVTRQEFENLIKPAAEMTIVPQGEVYFANLLHAINRETSP